MADRKPLVLIDGIPQGLPSGDALLKADVSLGNVDNVSDANKPVSSATQTALNLKANLAAPAFTGDATFDTDTLKIDATNNRVGVGTVSPAVALDVVGTIHASTGIKFGSNAVGGAISGVTLGDYEAGTWTPTIGGTATYSVNQGYYTKIGDLVTLSFDIIVTSIGTGSTYLIYGLPFTASSVINGGGYCASGYVGYFQDIATSVVALMPAIDSSTTILTIRSLTAAATAPGTSAIFKNGARIAGGITYKV